MTNKSVDDDITDAFIKWNPFTLAQVNIRGLLSPLAHLQCDIVRLCGYTLHGFITAAASTPVEDHTGRDVRMLSVLWILLEDIHQDLSGLT